MSTLQPEARKIVEDYLSPDAAVRDQLGGGIDGIVFSTSRATAVKLHAQTHTFNRELAAYRRLREKRVQTVCGFAVPQLLGADTDRRILEITIVQPPYLLGFAGSYLDTPPDFSGQVWEQWRDARADEFGDDWPLALHLYETLAARLGLFFFDLSPRNVNPRGLA